MFDVLEQTVGVAKGIGAPYSARFSQRKAFLNVASPVAWGPIQRPPTGASVFARLDHWGGCLGPQPNAVMHRGERVACTSVLRYRTC